MDSSLGYSFEEFCGSELWNENLTWYPGGDNLPDITPCLENLSLIWLPCFYLWMCFIPYIWFLKVSFKSRSRERPSTQSTIKSILPVVLAGLQIYELYRYFSPHISHPADLISAILSISSLVLAGGLVLLYRSYGQFTSGVLCIYWLLCAITSLARTYLYYKRFFWDGEHNDGDEIRLGLYTTNTILYLLCFILSCISDANEAALLKYQGISREVTASFPSLLMFHFINKMMRVGHAKKRAGGGIEREDLYNLAPQDRVDYFYPSFETDWNNRIEAWRKKTAAMRQPEPEPQPQNNIQEEADESTPLIIDPSKKKSEEKQASLSLVAVVLKHWLPLLSLGWFMRLACVLLSFLHPVLIKWLIEYTETQSSSTPDPLWKGIAFSIATLVIFILNALTWNVLYFTDTKARLRIRSSLMISIYKKALSMSGEAKEKSTTGEIVNLMSVDARRTVGFVDEFWVYLVTPIQTSVAMYMLYQLLGNSIFAGVSIMLLATPVSGVIGWLQRRIRLALMKIKDERIRMINETLTSIKVIKLYAWEPSFEKKIADLRKSETNKQRTVNILSAVQDTIYDVIPILVTVVTFAIYTTTQPDHLLKPSVAFVAISLFDLLKDPLTRLPRSISYLIMASVSVKRLVNFFKNADLDPSNVQSDDVSGFAIRLEDCIFSHLKTKPVVLHNISLSIKPGSLTALVGSVGAGKSSLLSSLVGDLYKHQGIVTVKGSVALVAQQAFILNATVKNNILFGADYNEDRYNKVIESCALNADLEVLPKGDKSMIGEKGINLSGGQKQRISLARAVYNDADVYLLDDPLSAVDAHVGKHIFDQVIGPNGLLKDKTRFMVTHGIQWLPHVDQIHVLNNGRMTEHGTYDSLLTHNGDFSKFLKKYYLNENSDEISLESEDEEEEGTQFKQKLLERLESATCQRQTSITEADTETDSPSDEEDEEDDECDVYDEQEEVETGHVTWPVYASYFKAMGSRWVLLALLLVVADGGLTVGFSIWLSMWTGDPIFSDSSNSTGIEKQAAMENYLGGLTGFGVSQIVTLLFFTITAAFCFCRASVNLHRQLLNNLLKAKASFFDVKPLGMILNRFSKDMDIIDNSVGWSLTYFTWTIISVASSIGGIIYATPLFIFAIVPIFCLYLYIQRFYISTSRQLRRLLSKASSPIYAHFSETLNGSQTIRAYKQQERFIQENIDKVERFNIFRYHDDLVDCWLDIRMSCTAGLLVFLTALFCVASSRIPYLEKHITSSLVGLALTLVFDVTNSLNGLVWTVSNVETDIVSVERIKEYSEVEQEANWHSNHRPAAGWPRNGILQFINFAACYRPELDMVIKDFSLEIKSQEKVGIVGRTGAGKSSLTLSLFRVIESAAGSIVIDGVDISKLGLHELRNSLTILPQDPMLFSGSIRENLDPFSEFSDDTLWTVLEQCQLKDYVREKPELLSAECGEGGKNLSVGQRQLVCLARALLRKTKILIMDEATAAVDLQTDDFIQKTIRSQFADCTILTIAHRLNTIIDCDRILVMGQGRIVEFDTPANLLANKQGVFYGMAKDAGLVS